MHDTTLPNHTKYYWGYQYRLAREFLVPYLQRHGAFQSGARIAEIGCAEAGVAMAFIEAGATDVLGTDIQEQRLHYARQIAHTLHLPLSLSTHNVLSDDIPNHWHRAFDLVILRDVIEHLDDTYHALLTIQHLLAPGGCVFIEFPPYTSPYGGHQHLLRNFWGKLPYVHLLPEALFRRMTLSGWHPVDIHEVQRLARIRLTVSAFKQAAQSAHYVIDREQYFLLRPVFHIKFGLPVVPLTALRWIPGIQEYCSLEANYILRSTLYSSSAEASSTVHSEQRYSM
ncbi:MAG: methyltransferase [Bacteroidota bacterium]|nr:methyltransferase [Candidatus Kapabacteria bacterium]MDW8219619.1 methyltransferase [Bacteroidota bacterium]